jgi:capsular exopolysaccharide synthesis family protein
LNPPELLGSPDTRRFLQDLKERFDVIVIDSPPVLALTDAQVLCSQVDGVVMIVAAESTSKEEVQRAQAMLRHAGGRLLGAVFNKVRRADSTPGYGTYASYGPNMLGRDRALSESVGTLAKR